MEDQKLVIARRHLELVQQGKSREDALTDLQNEGVVSRELTPEARQLLLDEFSSTLFSYIESLNPRGRR